MHESLRSLYELYVDDIYRYAKLTIGNSDEAKDVTQEVFLRAYRSWSNFRSEASPKTWLMTIARNYIYDLFRKNRTKKNTITEYINSQTWATRSIELHGSGSPLVNQTDFTWSKLAIGFG